MYHGDKRSKKKEKKKTDRNKRESWNVWSRFAQIFRVRYITRSVNHPRKSSIRSRWCYFLPLSSYVRAIWKKRSIRAIEREREERIGSRGNLRHFVSRVAPILSKFHARPRSRFCGFCRDFVAQNRGDNDGNEAWGKRGKARVDETRVCNFDG